LHLVRHMLQHCRVGHLLLLQLMLEVTLQLLLLLLPHAVVVGELAVTLDFLLPQPPQQ
jgi:hypothetical protein